MARLPRHLNPYKTGLAVGVGYGVGSFGHGFRTTQHHDHVNRRTITETHIPHPHLGRALAVGIGGAVAAEGYNRYRKKHPPHRRGY